MRLLKIILIYGLLFSVNSVYAVKDIELNNMEDEPRFNVLANELRCMVCQNQSIADSNAGLARDFRNQVKEKINAGQSNDEIVEYMVDRYGDYIMYRPPFNMTTALLWLGPFLLMIAGLFIVFRMTRKKRASNDEEDTPDGSDASMKDKQAKLKQMLADDQESET